MSVGGDGLARKTLHIAMGAFALLLRFLTPLQAAGMAILALLFNLLVLHRITGGRFLRGHERARGFSIGIALYPVSVLALIVVFQRSLHIAAGAWALLAFGDGMAAIVGTRLGGARLPWNREKTWVGLVAFVAFGAPAAAFLVHWVRPAAIADVRLLVLGCAIAALLAGCAESIRWGLDDNVVVPFVGGSALYLAFLIEPSLLARSADAFPRNALIGLGVNLVLAAAAWAARGVDASGVVAGVVVGTALFTFTGPSGFALLLSFFVLGTVATRVGFARKAALGIAERRGGRRGAPEALANVAAAVAFGFLSVATPEQSLFRIAFVAALATAAADTVASEIGQAFGRGHFLATTLRRVPAGTDGAVSMQGTVAGVGAALLMAAVAVALGLLGPAAALTVAVAAIVGSFLESVMGATVQERLAIGNAALNFTNTLAGATVALVLARVFGIA